MTYSQALVQELHPDSQTMDLGIRVDVAVDQLLLVVVDMPLANMIQQQQLQQAIVMLL